MVTNNPAPINPTVKEVRESGFVNASAWKEANGTSRVTPININPSGAPSLTIINTKTGQVIRQGSSGSPISEYGNTSIPYTERVNIALQEQAAINASKPLSVAPPMNAPISVSSVNYLNNVGEVRSATPKEIYENKAILAPNSSLAGSANAQAILYVQPEASTMPESSQEFFQPLTQNEINKAYTNPFEEGAKKFKLEANQAMTTQNIFEINTPQQLPQIVKNLIKFENEFSNAFRIGSNAVSGGISGFGGSIFSNYYAYQQSQQMKIGTTPQETKTIFGKQSILLPEQIEYEPITQEQFNTNLRESRVIGSIAASAIPYFISPEIALTKQLIDIGASPDLETVGYNLAAGAVVGGGLSIVKGASGAIPGIAGKTVRTVGTYGVPLVFGGLAVVNVAQQAPVLLGSDEEVARQAEKKLFAGMGASFLGAQIGQGTVTTTQDFLGKKFGTEIPKIIKQENILTEEQGGNPYGRSPQNTPENLIKQFNAANKFSKELGFDKDSGLFYHTTNAPRFTEFGAGTSETQGGFVSTTPLPIYSRTLAGQSGYNYTAFESWSGNGRILVGKTPIAMRIPNEYLTDFPTANLFFSKPVGKLSTIYSTPSNEFGFKTEPEGLFVKGTKFEIDTTGFNLINRLLGYKYYTTVQGVGKLGLPYEQILPIQKINIILPTATNLPTEENYINTSFYKNLGIEPQSIQSKRISDVLAKEKIIERNFGVEGKVGDYQINTGKIEISTGLTPEQKFSVSTHELTHKITEPILFKNPQRLPELPQILKDFENLSIQNLGKVQGLKFARVVEASALRYPSESVAPEMLSRFAERFPEEVTGFPSTKTGNFLSKAFSNYEESLFYSKPTTLNINNGHLLAEINTTTVSSSSNNLLPEFGLLRSTFYGLPSQSKSTSTQSVPSISIPEYTPSKSYSNISSFVIYPKSSKSSIQSNVSQSLPSISKISNQSLSSRNNSSSSSITSSNISPAISISESSTSQSSSQSFQSYSQASSSSQSSYVKQEFSSSNKRKDDENKKLKKFLQGFIPQVRKKGKFVNIGNEILPENLALQKAANFARKNLTRSITLKPAGQIEVNNDMFNVNLSDFRQRKPSSKIQGYPVFIQRNALSSKSETTEIQQAKAQKHLNKMMGRY